MPSVYVREHTVCNEHIEVYSTLFWSEFMYILVAKQLLIMSLIAIISFIFSKWKKAGEAESKYLSNLLLFVISPCLIINAFNIDYDMNKIKQTSLVLMIALSIQLILSAIAHLFIHSRTDIGKQRDPIDKMAIVYSNAGFIGIPLINGVFGQSGVFLLMGYIVMYNIFLWTHGIYLITHKISIKQIFLNVNIIAIIAGMTLFILPGKLPDAISRTIKIIGDLNTAVSMILLGILFANFKKPEKGEKSPSFRILVTVGLRLIVAPLVLLLFMWIGEHYIFTGTDIRKIFIILFIAASCPVGMSVANFSVLYDRKNVSYGSLLVSITSLFCVITIPLLVKLAETVL